MFKQFLKQSMNFLTKFGMTGINYFDILEKKTGKEKTHPEIMKAARKAAKAVEKKYGRKNLGPHNDFEWGMINGKLSTLRWVLGDEWDMLDT